jgi:hypothetical protein
MAVQEGRGAHGCVVLERGRSQCLNEALADDCVYECAPS